MRKTPPAFAGFGNGRGPQAKQCGQPLEARKDSKLITAPREHLGRAAFLGRTHGILEVSWKAENW